MPAKAPSPTPARFAGFDRAAIGFWHELAAEMSKAWFTANKARYETEWVAPMTALLATVRAKLVATYKAKQIVLGEPKVMRIHRDVRFSKDPSPYKTHIGAVISVAGKSLAGGGVAAVYVHLGADEELTGVGSYTFDATQLARWRKQVAGPAGVELAKVVTRLRTAGYQVGGHDDLKKVPKPYAADHPRGELLRMKGLTAMFPAIPEGMIHREGFADWLVEHARATAPLVAWIAKHVD